VRGRNKGRGNSNGLTRRKLQEIETEAPRREEKIEKQILRDVLPQAVVEEHRPAALKDFKRATGEAEAGDANP